MEEKKVESLGMVEGLSQQYTVDAGSVKNSSGAPHHDLHKKLEARHVVMIGLGGALGTGLLIGT
jgi:amino acid transporter